MLKSFHDIENALRDYSWMLKEISRLQDELNITNAKMTATYGIEATLPKGDGISDPTGREVVNRDRKNKTLKKFISKVDFIDRYSSVINDDRELTVLNCLLDGMSIVAISQHMSFSERRVYSIKDEIVKKMKENASNAENAGNAGNAGIAG